MRVQTLNSISWMCLTNPFLEINERKTTHNLLIIGESVKHMPQEILEQYPNVEWRKIAGLRDIIAHSYFTIKPSLLWNIIVSKIQPLKETVESILAESN